MSLCLLSKKSLADEFSVNFEKFRKVQSSRKKPCNYTIFKTSQRLSGDDRAVCMTWISKQCFSDMNGNILEKSGQQQNESSQYNIKVKCDPQA